MLRKAPVNSVKGFETPYEQKRLLLKKKIEICFLICTSVSSVHRYMHLKTFSEALYNIFQKYNGFLQELHRAICMAANSDPILAS